MMCRRIKFGNNHSHIQHLPYTFTFSASLGDLVTLLLLSEISSKLYNDKEDGWLAPLLISIYILFVPVCIYVARRNDDIKKGMYFNE